MVEPGPLQRGRENLTGIVSVLVTGIWLVGLVTGQSWWLGFMLFGYVVIVPIVAMLFSDEEDVEEWWDDEQSSGDEQVTTDSNRNRSQNRNQNRTRDRESAAEEDAKDALETLRDRYARGELTDEQFERKVERLLETETLEDVEDRARGSGPDADAGAGETRRETDRGERERNRSR